MFKEAQETHFSTQHGLQRICRLNSAPKRIKDRGILKIQGCFHFFPGSEALEEAIINAVSP